MPSVVRKRDPVTTMAAPLDSSVGAWLSDPAVTASGWLGGVVWAIAQPYRVALFHPAGKGLYDWLVEPPLLVVAVGLLFAAVIVPGIIEDLRGER